MVMVVGMPARVKTASCVKATAQVKTATSSHTEAAAHMAAATPTARERIGSSKRNNQRDSREQRSRGLQF